MKWLIQWMMCPPFEQLKSFWGFTLYKESSSRLCRLISFADPLPPKKRHLRIFHNLSSDWNETPGTLLSQALREAEPLYVSSPAPLEQPVQIVLADSVNNLQPHQEEATTNNEQPFSTEDSLLRIKTSTTPSGTEPPYVNSTVTLATNSAEISQRRPSDPRLGNSCPVSSSGVNPALSPGGGWPVVTSAVPALAVAGQPVLSYSQHNDSSGTPGKKKVRFSLCYCCCCNYCYCYYYFYYYYYYYSSSLKHSRCVYCPPAHFCVRVVQLPLYFLASKEQGYFVSCYCRSHPVAEDFLLVLRCPTFPKSTLLDANLVT